MVASTPVPSPVTTAGSATGHAAAFWSSAWNRAALLIALVAAAYFQTWSDLWPLWENKNATYTHGSLIALIAVWLVWRARRKLHAVEARPLPAALPAVLGLSFAWLLAARANLLLAHSMLWPLLALAVVLAGAGWRAARAMALPLGFVYFAVPVWDLLMPVLQAITSFVVGGLTGLIGITAVVDVHHVLLPHDTIYIATTCSGAHFLSVALAVGLLAGEIRGDRLSVRLLIMAIAAVLSMVFNWLRVFLIVLAYLHPDLKAFFETIGHITFGWWVFALDLLVFFLVLRLVPSSPTPVPVEAPATAGSGVRASAAAFWAAALAAVLLPAISWAMTNSGSYPSTVAAAPRLPNASGPISPDVYWHPAFGGAAWEHRVAYVTNEGRVVELYRNEYHAQSQGDELIANDSLLFDPASFKLSRTDRARIGGAEAVDSTIEVNAVELRDLAGRDWASLYYYQVDDRPIASARRAQLVTAWRAIYASPTAGVLAVAMPCVPDCAAVRPVLEDTLLEARAAYREARRMP